MLFCDGDLILILHAHNVTL